LIRRPARSGCSAKSSVSVQCQRIPHGCNTIATRRTTSRSRSGAAAARADPRMVLGLSGGLDSAHALIVAARAMDREGRPRSDILAFTLEPTGGVRLVGALGSHNDVDRRAEPVRVPAGRAAEPRCRPSGSRLLARTPPLGSTRLLQLRPRRRDAIERCDVEEIPFLLSSEAFRSCSGRRTSARSPPVSTSQTPEWVERHRAEAVPHEGDGTSATWLQDRGSTSLRRR